MENEMHESESAAQVAGFAIRFHGKELPNGGFTDAELKWFAKGDYWGDGEDRDESNHQE